MQPVVSVFTILLVALAGVRMYRTASSDAAQVLHLRTLLGDAELRLSQADVAFKKLSRTTAEASGDMRQQRDRVEESCLVAERQARFGLDSLQLQLDDCRATHAAATVRLEALLSTQCAALAREADARVASAEDASRNAAFELVKAKNALLVAQRRIESLHAAMSGTAGCLHKWELAHNVTNVMVRLGSVSPLSVPEYLLPWHSKAGAFVWVGCPSMELVAPLRLQSVPVALFVDPVQLPSLEAHAACVSVSNSPLLVGTFSRTETIESRVLEWEHAKGRVWMMRFGCDTPLKGFDHAWAILANPSVRPFVLQIDGFTATDLASRLSAWGYSVHSCRGAENQAMRNCVFVHSSISSTIRAPPVQRGVEVAQFVESYFLLQDQAHQATSAEARDVYLERMRNAREVLIGMASGVLRDGTRDVKQ